MDILVRTEAFRRAPVLCRWRAVLPVITLLGFGLLPPHGVAAAFANDALSREHGIKAAFLYNFAKFIEWPAEIETSQAPFVVCLLGRPAFSAAMHTIEGKSVRGKMLVVKDISGEAAFQDCQLMVFSDTYARQIEMYAPRTSSLAILTVADTPQFAGSGGAIGYYIEGDKVRFEINTEVTKNHGLSVSSRLLNVAGRIVR